MNYSSKAIAACVTLSRSRVCQSFDPELSTHLKSLAIDQACDIGMATFEMPPALAAPGYAALGDAFRSGNYELRQQQEYEQAQRDRKAAIDEWLSPFNGEIEAWWDSLTIDDQSSWDAAYEAYMYGPDGDRILESEDPAVAEILGYLQEKDPYLAQPFCPYCDSRGHEPGACMRR